MGRGPGWPQPLQQLRGAGPARDNIPVLSWLLLRGRCRGCGERIPAFHPIVELLVPLLFLGGVVDRLDWRLLPVLGLIPAGVAVSAIDLRTMIVPTRIVWPAFGLIVVLSLIVGTLESQPAWLVTCWLVW